MNMPASLRRPLIRALRGPLPWRRAWPGVRVVGVYLSALGLALGWVQGWTPLLVIAEWLQYCATLARATVAVSFDQSVPVIVVGEHTQLLTTPSGLSTTAVVLISVAGVLFLAAVGNAMVAGLRSDSGTPRVALGCTGAAVLAGSVVFGGGASAWSGVACGSWLFVAALVPWDWMTRLVGSVVAICCGAYLALAGVFAMVTREAGPLGDLVTQAPQVYIVARLVYLTSCFGGGLSVVRRCARTSRRWRVKQLRATARAVSIQR